MELENGLQEMTVIFSFEESYKLHDITHVDSLPKNHVQIGISTAHTVNPLLSSPGGLFISSPFEGGGGLIEIGGLFERGGLFILEKTIVSVLHKELEYEVEKLK